MFNSCAFYDSKIKKRYYLPLFISLKVDQRITVFGISIKYTWFGEK